MLTTLIQEITLHKAGEQASVAIKKIKAKNLWEANSMDRRGEQETREQTPSNLVAGTPTKHEQARSAESKKRESLLRETATTRRMEARLAARRASLQAEEQGLQEEQQSLEEEQKSLEEEKKSLQEEEKSLREEQKSLQEEERTLLRQRAEISKSLIPLSPDSKDGQWLRIDLDYVIARLRGVRRALRDVQERQRAAHKACTSVDEQLLSLHKQLEKLEASVQLSRDALLRLEIKETETETSTNLIANSAVVRAVNHAMERLERKMEQSLKGLRQDLKELSTYVMPEIRRLIIRRCNPWKYPTSTAGSSQARDDFKRRLIAYYGAASTNRSQRGFVKDMVTGRFFPSRYVTAAQIWKWSTRGEGLKEFFGLTIADLKSERNGLLLLDAVEEAFDMLEVCFIYDPLQQHLRRFVVNPELKKRLITWDYKLQRALPGAQVCFEHVHNQPLHLISKENRPFLRILAHHARLCLDEAKTEGWVTDDLELAELERVRESLAASESALWPKHMEKYPEAHLARPQRPDWTDESCRGNDESLPLAGR